MTGGPAQKICDAPTGSDGSWSRDGVILFDGTGADPIQRVSAAGGTPVLAVKAETSRKETTVGWPEFLPDGRHFLYMATAEKAEDNTYRIGTLDSTETKVVAPAQTLLTYAPPGYLLFLRDKTLVAQRFDAKALKTSGEPVPLVEHVGTGTVGLARFSVSGEGTLAYRTGESGDRLVWVDGTGREIETIGDPGENHNPALSPGGDRLAYDLADPRSSKADIWVRDLRRGVPSRLTFGPGDRSVPFGRPTAGPFVYTKGAGPLREARGRAAARRASSSSSMCLKIACSLVTREARPSSSRGSPRKRGGTSGRFRCPGKQKPVPFLKTPFFEGATRCSRQTGKYLAYQSNESGRSEVYVQSFPGPGGKRQISRCGGTRASMGRRRQGALLPRSRSKAHDGRDSGGETFTAGIPQAALPGPLRPSVSPGTATS